MKVTHFWASTALFATATYAQVTQTASSPTSTTSAEPSCTASLITKLCDYPSPGPEFAVASSGIDHCLGYCNDHQPCEFVIFARGNPYTGTGTCWLYPGKSFDASAGDTDCGDPYLSVFSKPECAGGTPTEPGACTATASPSAVASICGYEPPETCFETCVAAESSANCLHWCAERESCSYVVFVPRNPSGSPYASGTCWIYPEGKFDESKATECSGEPEQFVYDNVCPKPKPSLSPSSASASSPPSSSPTGTGTGGEGGQGDAAESQTSGPENTGKENLAAGSLLSYTSLVGAAALMWYNLR